MYRTFNKNIDNLEAFRRGKNGALLETHAKVWARFGLPSKSANFSLLNNVDHAELLILLNACLDLQQDMAKVQWFDRLNHEVIERLFAKLERLDLGNTAHERCRSRWFTLQNELNTALTNIPENLKSLVVDIRQTIATSPKGPTISLFLGRASNQDGLTAFHYKLFLALRNNGEAAVLLESMRHEQGLSATTTQNVLRDALEYSILIHPHLVASLLSSATIRESSVVNHELVNFLVTITGQNTIGGINDSDVIYSRPFDAHQNGDLLAQLLGSLGAEARKVLLSKDLFGRFPLHLAARYGLLSICRVILEVFAGSDDRGIFKHALLSPDKEGQTALDYAVTGNHLPIVKMFLDLICANKGDYDVQTSLGEILVTALRCQHDTIVSCIIDHDANINCRTTRGETPLHIAAQLGRFDYTEKLLRAKSKQDAEIDVAERTRGWTPLFTACAGGFLEIVKLLLEVGANQQTKDYSGWTSKEHAAFRGHLLIAELFQTSESDELRGGPVDILKPSNKNIQIHVGSTEKIIFVNLGSAQGGNDVDAVDKTFCSSKYTSDSCKDFSYVLEISAPDTDQSPMRLLLPILDDRINEPLVFRIGEHAKLRLVLKVFQTHLSTQLEGKLVAIGTALLEENENHLGVHCQSMIKEFAVTMTDRDAMRIAGCVNLTYLVAGAYPHLQTPQFPDYMLGDGNRPVLVGHRG